MTEQPFAIKHEQLTALRVWVGQAEATSAKRTDTIPDTSAMPLAERPTEEDWCRLGSHLRNGRLRHGWSQEVFAGIVKLDRSTIQRIEEGNSAPRLAHVWAMEAALGWWPGNSMELLAAVSPTSPVSSFPAGPDPDVVATLRAPWSGDQVASLNRYQRADWMPPFTCGGDHQSGGPILIAQTGGWKCPDPGCDYVTDWVYAHMVNIDQWATRGVGSPVVTGQ